VPIISLFVLAHFTAHMWLKHNIFGLFHSAYHFHLCPRTFFPTVSLSNPYHCILSANSRIKQDVFQFPKSIFHKHTPVWGPQRKQILCVMITLPQENDLGRCWFYTEIRRRQSPVSAHPFISVCFICTSSSQGKIVSPFKNWTRCDFLIATIK